MVGWRYYPMTRVLDVPLTTSQLTTFSLWKRVNSISHHVGRSKEISSTPPCALPVLAVRAVEQIVS